MAWPSNIDHVEILLLDDTVQMHVDEVQPRRRAPVTEQARLDVRARQRLLQQGIVVEVNLSDGQVIGCAPIGVNQREVLLGSYRLHGYLSINRKRLRLRLRLR